MKINNQEPSVSTKNEDIDIYDYINTSTVPAIIYIPNNTIKLTITAKIMDDDDSIREAVMTLGVAEVANARIDGDEWESDNVKYSLTDKAREELGML